MDTVTGERICEGCAAVLAQDAKFCNQCGIEVLLIETPAVIKPVVCQYCNSAVTADMLYCSNCGQSQAVIEFDHESNSEGSLASTFIFYALLLGICLISGFVTDPFDLQSDIILSLSMTAVAVTWALAERKTVFPLFRWPKFSLVKLLAYSALTVVGSIAVNYTVSWLNLALFDTDFSMTETYLSEPYGKWLAILMIGVFPAVVEEVSFRGVVQGKLMQVMPAAQALLVTAFLFSILHLSVISLFWLIPFSILLGRIRMKENTLWYGIVIHFVFNTTACIIEFGSPF